MEAVREFTGKVAIVTGASSGIGMATAWEFARAGADVVLADVTPGEEIARAIASETGVRAKFVACDVSKGGDVEKLIRDTISAFGRLDFAFNNAGIEGQPAPTEACTEENWNRTIDINLKGTWLCMKYEIPAMRMNGGGAIVNCSSIAGVVGFAGIPAYVASKHGVIGLTKNAAMENAKTGIRVNAVCPGVIQTPMIDRFTGGSKEAAYSMAQQEPIGRMGRPEEIASAVIWLCSSKSSFVTGHPLVVDGGWVAQ